MSTEAIGASEAIEKVEMEGLPDWDDTGESIITMKELTDRGT